MSTDSIQLAVQVLDHSLDNAADDDRGLVFLSHSSRLRAENELCAGDTLNRHKHRKLYLRRVLEGLGPQLAAAGFQAWLDQTDLSPGERFDTLIYDALARCRAAVILIDRDALDSSYVMKEVTILAWRQVVGDPVYLLPVLLGDVTEEELRASTLGRQTGIEKLSSIRPTNRKSNGLAAHETATEICQRLVAALPDWEDLDSPSQRWIDDVSHFLSGVSDQALRRAARKIGVDQHAWHRTARKRQAIAASLLSCDVRKAYAVLRGLVYQLDNDRAEKTVKHTLPLWVDLQAARVVMQANDLSAQDRVVGLSTDNPSFGQHMAQRATACAPEFPVVTFPSITGEDPVNELIQRYDHSLRDLLNLPLHATYEQMAEYMEFSQGTFVVMRCEDHTPQTVRAVIDGLHQRFPGIVIVAVASSHHPIWHTAHIRQAYTKFTRDDEDQADWYIHSLGDLANIPREATDDN